MKQGDKARKNCAKELWRRTARKNFTVIGDISLFWRHHKPFRSIDFYLADVEG
jgi:hypothetical protein